MTEHVAALRPGTDVVVLYVRQPLEGLAAHLEGDPALEQRPVLVVPSPSLAATRAQAMEGSPRVAETAVSA